MLLYNIYIIMRYKIKKRPRRVLKDNKRLPYIKYKNKDISLKGYDIKSILKIINKLSKEVKSKRLDKTELKQKRDKINKYLSGQISSVMSGGPQQIVESRLKEDTEKIKELSNELQLYKSSKINSRELKMLENKKEDINESQQNIVDNLKMIKNDLDDMKNLKENIKDFIQYDKNKKKYRIDLGNNRVYLSDTITGIKKYFTETYDDLINKTKQLEEENKINIEKQQELDNKIKNIEIEKKQLKEEKKIVEFEKYLEILKRDYIKKLNENRSQEDLFKELEKRGLKKTEFIIKYKERYGRNIKKITNIKNEDIIEYLVDDFLINKREDLLQDFEKIQKQKQSQPEQKQPEQIQPQEEKEEEEEQQQEGEGLNKVNKGGLYNTDIDKIMKPFKEYLGCYANDQIDILIKYIKDNNIKKGGAIINTNNLKDKEGHWVAIWFDTIDDCEFSYYDPFGNNPRSNNFINKFKSMFEDMETECYIKVKINKIKQQSVSSNTCGWFSIKFLLERMNGITFKDATKYKKISNNENDIKELKQQYNKFGFI